MKLEGGYVSSVGSAAPGLLARRRRGELRVDRVRRLEDLEALREDWEDLEARAGVPHPFATHAWFTSWWEAFGDGLSLETLVVRQGGQCIAIAPLMLERSRAYGMPMRFLASATNDTTPRFEVLVDPEAPQGWAAVFDAIMAMADEWDVLRLAQLPEGCVTAAELEKMAGEAGMLSGWWESTRSPHVEGVTNWEKFFAELSPKLRQNVRRQTRRLEREGAIEFEEITDLRAFRRGLAEGLHLERAGWKGAAESAIACREDLSCFYRGMGERAMQHGWLAMHFLKVAGRRIAFSYGLRYREGIFLMKLGFDPSFAAYSPSILLLSQILQQAIAKGTHLVDLLGDDDTWKRRWAPQSLKHRWLYVVPNSMRGRMFFKLKFGLSPTVKSAVASLR